VIVGDADELLDQPLHEIDTDHCHFALGSSGEERPTLFGTPVKDGDAQMLEVWPRSDLGGPYGRCNELGSQTQTMLTLSVAYEISKRCQGRRTFASAEGRDGKGGVVFVQIGREALLVRAQDARKEGRVHGAIFPMASMRV
jgi:hypothetical protein